MLGILAALPLLIPAAPPGLQTDTSDCVCDYKEEGTTEIHYHRTFLKVLGSGFGLWGSTKVCKEVEIIKWKYEYSGPGQGPVLQSANKFELFSGMNSAEPLFTYQPLPQRMFRWMSAESECSDGLLVPYTDHPAAMLSYIALDGTSFDLPFRLESGTISHFLGTAFDAAKFDPTYVNSSAWTGIRTTLPLAAFQAPSLTYSVGSNPGIPVAAMMDLSNPDTKTLAIDLGVAAANRPFTVLVSETFQDAGMLGVVDGVRLPIVLDSMTAYFLEQHPELTGTLDSSGTATIQLPQLRGGPEADRDLSIAVVAHDPITGGVHSTTTYVGLTLRDLSYCGRKPE